MSFQSFGQSFSLVDADAVAAQDKRLHARRLLDACRHRLHCKNWPFRKFSICIILKIYIFYRNENNSFILEGFFVKI